MKWPMNYVWQGKSVLSTSRVSGVHLFGLCLDAAITSVHWMDAENVGTCTA